MTLLCLDDYTVILRRLHHHADEGYAAFSAKLIPGEFNFIGVRTPDLRKIAKEIVNGDWRGFLACAQDNFHEEVMLHAIVLANVPAKLCTIEERLELLGAFVPKVNNWAVCDTLCTDLKVSQQHRAAVFDFLAPYMQSAKEYDLRVAIVIMMKSFLCDEYIDRVLRFYSEVKHDGYYVKMGVAWALAEACVVYRDKVIDVLKSNCLDDFTHNKAIQKMRESRRISQDDKAYLSTLKRLASPKAAWPC